MVLWADGGNFPGQDIRVTLSSRRSSKYKRVVNSTLAGETQAALSSRAEAEWIQLMLRDVIDDKLPTDQCQWDPS